jgi:hypothetical protein
MKNITNIILIIIILASTNAISQESKKITLVGTKGFFSKNILIIEFNGEECNSMLIHQYYNGYYKILFEESLKKDKESDLFTGLKINLRERKNKIFAIYEEGPHKKSRYKLDTIIDAQRFNKLKNKSYLNDKLQSLTTFLDSTLGERNYLFHLSKSIDSIKMIEHKAYKDEIDDYLSRFSDSIISSESPNIALSLRLISNISSCNYIDFVNTINKLPANRQYFKDIIYSISISNPQMLIKYIEEHSDYESDVMNAIDYYPSKTKRNEIFKSIKQLDTDSVIKERILKLQKERRRDNARIIVGSTLAYGAMIAVLITMAL